MKYVECLKRDNDLLPVVAIHNIPVFVDSNQALVFEIEEIDNPLLKEGQLVDTYYSKSKNCVLYDYKYKQIPEESNIDQEKAAMAEAIIDLNSQIEDLKTQINKLSGGK